MERGHGISQAAHRTDINARAIKPSEIARLLADRCGVSIRVARQLLKTLANTAVSEVKERGQFVIPGIGRLVRIDQTDQKAQRDRNPPLPPKSSQKFHKEFEGTAKTPRRRRTAAADRTHGLVVNTLASELKRWQVSNDKSRDLYLSNRKGQMVALFEVKTATTLAHIHTAVGQLFLNSFRVLPCPALVLVAPDDIGLRTCAALAALKIEVLKYKITRNEVTFTRLPGLLSKIA